MMMKKILLYIKYQTGNLLFLMGVFVLPLGLFLEFSPYNVPKFPYVVLGALFVSQYVFYKEKYYRKKMGPIVEKSLEVEKGRVPSKNEIVQRSNLLVQFRGVSVAISALAILCLMFAFQEF